jgi:hypothetical protein
LPTDDDQALEAICIDKMRSMQRYRYPLRLLLDRMRILVARSPPSRMVCLFVILCSLSLSSSFSFVSLTSFVAKLACLFCLSCLRRRRQLLTNPEVRLE